MVKIYYTLLCSNYAAVSLKSSLQRAIIESELLLTVFDAILMTEIAVTEQSERLTLMLWRQV